jgi:hypothetical protein
MPVTLPACLSLGVAGRGTSWQVLLIHLLHKASAPEANPRLVEDVTIMALALAAVQRRFRQRCKRFAAASPGSQLWASAT